MIAVNEYFEGGVKSLSYSIKGQKATVGVMEEGTYTFGTAAPERMTVIQGELHAKMPHEADFRIYGDGSAFEVPGNASFDVKSIGQTSYLCEFL